MTTKTPNGHAETRYIETRASEREEPEAGLARLDVRARIRSRGWALANCLLDLQADDQTDRRAKTPSRSRGARVWHGE